MTHDDDPYQLRFPKQVRKHNPRNMGWEAFKNNVNRTDNPVYHPNEDRREWFLGWDNAYESNEAAKREAEREADEAAYLDPYAAMADLVEHMGQSQADKIKRLIEALIGKRHY